MKTPETTAGYLTENIMCRVRSKLPELPTHEYNRIYEAVLGELQCHVLPERQEASARHSNTCVSDGPADGNDKKSSAEGPFAARNG